MTTPAPRHLDAVTVLREVHDADRQVMSAFLSAADFNGIPPDGPTVLRAMSISSKMAGRLVRGLGIPEQAASEIIDALISHGYLECRIAPDQGGPASTGITERGRAALAVITEGVRAARWTGFTFRQDDIIISGPQKSGTTWVQMICALLIFQTPDLPAPLPRLSPWLDDLFVPRDEPLAGLSAQRHRRFIKSHLSLSHLPIDSRGTYIVVARHPLDAAVSLYYQFDFARINMPEPPRRSPRLPPHEWLLQWIDEPSLPEMMSPLSDAWTRRDMPNVVLMHYEDLSADLEGEMRRLAARLGIAVPSAAWPGLVKAATFDQMRAAADRLQPLPDLKDDAAFFRRGSSGSGRELLTSAELARYHERVARLAPADLVTWLHRQDRPACASD